MDAGAIINGLATAARAGEVDLKPLFKNLPPDAAAELRRKTQGESQPPLAMLGPGGCFTRCINE